MYSKSVRYRFLAATFLYWISLYLYVPTLPTYVYDRTLSLTVVGVVLSMYGLWQAFVRIPVGVAVDTSGRGKLFIVAGFLFSVAGALVLGAGGRVPALVAGRALTGIAAGTWVPLIAVFSGMFPPSQAVFATSLLTVSGSIGRMLATGTNGFFNNLGGYSLTFSLAAASAVAAIALVATTPLRRNESRSVTFASVAALFRRADIMLPSMISLVGQTGNWAVTFGFLPILAAQLGGDDVVKGLLVGLNLAALTAGNMLNTIIVRRVRHIPLITISIAAFAAAIGFIALSDSLSGLFAAAAVMGLANGFSYPTLMGLSIRRVDQSHRSSAMGIHQSIYAVGMFAGPWLGGLLADAVGIRTMFGVSAAFIMIGSLGLIALYAASLRRTGDPTSAAPG